MFIPYQTTIDEIRNLYGYERILIPRLEQEESNALEILKSKAMVGENEIDGNSLKKNWLPVGKHYDVFISYSHNDKLDALKLVSWLTSKGVSCFVDSVYWSNCDKLLKAIDDQWCKKTNGYYDYEKRNYTSSLVHAMLSMAMLEAIDHCDFAIFIKSESTVAFDYNNMRSTTYSPWVWEEINYMTSIEKRLPEFLREPSTKMFCREGGILLEREDRGVPVKMKFPLPADKMVSITSQDLETSQGNGSEFLRNLLMKHIAEQRYFGLQRR